MDPDRARLVPARYAADDADLSPIEVLWPAYPKQNVFRSEWLTHRLFSVTHLRFRSRLS